MPTQKKFTTIKQFQEAIDKYFSDCEIKKIPYTICWLALALWFTSRRALLNYWKKEWYEKYFPILKKAKLKVEQQNEERLYSWANTTWTIFNLKCNFERQDKEVIEQKSENINYNFNMEDIENKSTKELEIIRKNLLS